MDSLSLKDIGELNGVKDTNHKLGQSGAEERVHADTKDTVK